MHPLDDGMFFAAINRSILFRFTDEGRVRLGGSELFGEANSTRIALTAPFFRNGVDSTLYFGTWRLLVSTDLGETWTPPAGDLDLTFGGPIDRLSAMSLAPLDRRVIYAGSVQARVTVSTDGGTSWRDIRGGLPNRVKTEIAIAPDDRATAYLSVSGYGTGHVFKTTDMGVTWKDVSSGLPDVPANALLIDPLDPAVVYVGTDIGVFRSTTGGADWESFDNGLPPVVVTGFAAQPNGVIRLSTYGRGVYELGPDDAGPNDFYFVVNNPRLGVEIGGSTEISMRLMGRGDFNSPVELSIAVSPPEQNLEVSLSSTKVAPGDAFAVNIKASATTPASFFNVRIAGTADGITRSLSFRLKTAVPKPPEPVVLMSLQIKGKKWILGGKNFGDAPRVIINEVDRSEFIRSTTDTQIKIKAKAAQLGIHDGQNSLQVIGAGGVPSNVQIYTRQ